MCWEYYSRTALKTDQGEMAGQLLVALLEPAQPAGSSSSSSSSADQHHQDMSTAGRAVVPIGPFKLQTMAVAAQNRQQHHRQ
jgi:hypothetical protein